jgi:hypothetical protein
MTQHARRQRVDILDKPGHDAKGIDRRIPKGVAST